MRRLKILIATMIIILVFMLGYNQWHTEDIILEMQEAQTSIEEETVSKKEETAIYTRDMTEERLANQVNELIGDYSISYAIVHICASKVEDYKKCIWDIVWVSNAESSMFKKGMYPSNNGFWLMQKTKNGYIKRRFSSIEEGIEYWVNLYVEKWWGNRANAEARLKWNYCTSECKWWIKAFNSAIKKLSLD